MKKNNPAARWRNPTANCNWPTVSVKPTALGTCPANRLWPSFGYTFYRGPSYGLSFLSSQDLILTVNMFRVHRVTSFSFNVRQAESPTGTTPDWFPQKNLLTWWHADVGDSENIGRQLSHPSHDLDWQAIAQNASRLQQWHWELMWFAKTHMGSRYLTGMPCIHWWTSANSWNFQPLPLMWLILMSEINCACGTHNF